VANRVSVGNDTRNAEIVRLIKEESNFFTRDGVDVIKYKTDKRCTWEEGGGCERCEGRDDPSQRG
jgi:hypothetical protein